MNSSLFKICTYNMGSRINDYLKLYRHLNIPYSIESIEREVNPKYLSAQNKTAELLGDKAQVFCLQEVGDESRPFIQSLKENFEIIHVASHEFDNAIALDKRRFKDITNHSSSIKISDNFVGDVAITTATDIQTNQRLIFVSAHAPGFDFSNIVEEEARHGDVYCHAIAKRLSNIGRGALQFIGADMNATPQNRNQRFQAFFHNGFDIHRINSATNVHPDDPHNPIDQNREIDFIFTKNSSTIWQKIKSIFISTFQFKNSIKNENLLGWNIESNASDHLPVFLEVTAKLNISKIRQLWNAAKYLFSSCFRACSAF